MKVNSYTWTKYQGEKRESRRERASDAVRVDSGGAGGASGAGGGSHHQGKPMVPWHRQSQIIDSERRTRIRIQEDDGISKAKHWAERLVGKFRRDINSQYRDLFVHSLLMDPRPTNSDEIGCVLTNPDSKRQDEAHRPPSTVKQSVAIRHCHSCLVLGLTARVNRRRADYQGLWPPTLYSALAYVYRGQGDRLHYRQCLR